MCQSNFHVDPHKGSGFIRSVTMGAGGAVGRPANDNNWADVRTTLIERGLIESYCDWCSAGGDSINYIERVIEGDGGKRAVSQLCVIIIMIVGNMN